MYNLKSPWKLDIQKFKANANSERITPVSKACSSPSDRVRQRYGSQCFSFRRVFVVVDGNLAITRPYIDDRDEKRRRNCESKRR